MVRRLSFRLRDAHNRFKRRLAPDFNNRNRRRDLQKEKSCREPPISQGEWPKSLCRNVAKIVKSFGLQRNTINPMTEYS